MVNLLAKILISALSVIVAGQILPGVHVDSYQTAFLVAIVLGVINMFIRPILLVLTLPLTLLTFGLFAFVLNAFLILLVDYLIPGLTIDNFLWALAFSLVVSLVSSFLNTLVKN